MNKEKHRERQLKYWRRRNAELSKIVDAEADEVIRNMREAYDAAAAHIDQQITSWYQKFADDNEITFQKAKQTLDAGELKDFKMTLEEYIRHGEELDEDPSWLKAMKNASAKHHITRLDALKMTAQAELEEAIAKIDGTWMEDAAKKAYLYSLYSTQLSLGVAFNAPNIDMVVRAARKPWTPDGMEFVERKAVNNAKLVQKVQRELTQAAITGEKYEVLAERLSKDFALTQYESMRIIRTESTHLETEASMQAYKDCSIDRYQNLVTLDEKTCEVCAEMDLTIWKVADRLDGYNAPPFHPNCRCTTIPYFDDPELATTRAARNAAGKTIFVDDSMSYEEWYDEYAAPDFSNYDITEGGKYKLLPRNMSKEEYADYIQPFIEAQFISPDNPKGMTLREYKQIWNKKYGYIQASPSYQEINNVWRGVKNSKPLSKEQKRTAKDLERLTKTFELPESYVCFRKVDSNYLNDFLGVDVTGTGRGFLPRKNGSAEEAVEAINEMVKDGPISVPDDAVTSVSLVEGLNYFKMRPVLIEIQVDGGTKGLITDNFPESEFIAKRKSNIDIFGATSYNYQDKTYIKLFARMVQ